MTKRTSYRSLSRGIIVDSFAGGGGASTAIEMALGVSPDIAINHDADALAMHEANHPNTKHLVTDVWDVDPVVAAAGRTVDLAWYSPNCQHFSKAKGGKPRNAKIRSLAWVIIRWARTVRPRLIFCENVVEWKTWGNLLPDGTPCPKRKGKTFRTWLSKLKACGYEVEMRELRACDYGAPTTRKRLFIIARCDGQPIVWPTPTHGPGRAHPWRTAAEIIDWSMPCPSIFERSKPLAEKTLARIARGIDRFVLRGEPYVVNGGAPTLIQTGYGERPGQAPRSLDLKDPLGTVVAGGAKHALVMAWLAKHYGGNENSGLSVQDPLATITTQDHHALVTASTVGAHAEEVRAFLTQYNGSSIGQSLQQPLGTITTHDRFGIVTVKGEKYQIADISMRMLSPRELFRAQGFDDDYIIDPIVNGKRLSQTAQIRMVGNSVSPPVAAAIVRANVSQAAVAA